MILCDFSQTMRACVAVDTGFSKKAFVTEDYIRHLILNSLRANVSKFKHEYGELVLAVDGKNYWRKRHFPYYKAKRAKAAKESPLDWGLIHATLDKLKEEFTQFMPYRMVGTDEAEADDVVATLARHYRDREKILILSRDEDFVQLHDPFLDDVVQYDPIGKKWVRNNDPEKQFMTKVIKGDTGDGIPNVHTRDDWFVSTEKGARQKAITQGLLEQYMDELPKGVGDPDTVKNYNRNRLLIDLVNTPGDVQDKILTSYQSQEGKTRAKMLNYFIDKRLRQLTQNINDF